MAASASSYTLFWLSSFSKSIGSAFSVFIFLSYCFFGCTGVISSTAGCYNKDDIVWSIWSVARKSLFSSSTPYSKMSMPCYRVYVSSIWFCWSSTCCWTSASIFPNYSSFLTFFKLLIAYDSIILVFISFFFYFNFSSACAWASS